MLLQYMQMMEKNGIGGHASRLICDAAGELPGFGIRPWLHEMMKERIVGAASPTCWGLGSDKSFLYLSIVGLDEESNLRHCMNRRLPPVDDRYQVLGTILYALV
jgi:hypothetical protein